MNGFVNLIKPCGATASDMVVCLKHIYSVKKVGHMGTLDPGAVGVLPVAVGKATCLFDYLTDKRKVYRAWFTFGKTTDTLDSYGKVTETSDVPDFNDVKLAVKNFVGQIQQIPPLYSAVNINGRRAYDLARRGQPVQLKSRTVNVYSIDIVRTEGNDTFVFDIECGGGTYIRSLCRDIASSLGCVAYMSALIRMSSSPFDISSAVTIDEVRVDPLKYLLPLDVALTGVDDYVFDSTLYKKLCDGFRPECSFDGYKKIYCNGVLFGLGRCSDGRLHLDYYLKDANN